MEVYSWIEQIQKSRGRTLTKEDFEDFFCEYKELKQIIDESDVDTKNKNKKSVIDV